MIDKIDRPEAPPSYRITESKQTAEDRHQGHQPREEAEKRLREQLEGKEWNKFHRKVTTIKPLRVKREQLDHCIFRSVILRSGSAILVANVVWKNGQTTERAIFLLPKLEDYFKLKHTKPGDIVPEAFWAHGEEVEMGIPQDVGDSGRFPAPTLGGSEMPQAPTMEGKRKHLPWTVAVGLVNATTGRLQWGPIIGVTIGIIIIILAVVQSR